MKSKLSKKFGTGVIVLLITVCFIPAFAGAFAPGEGRQDMRFEKRGHHRSALGIWRNPRMVQKLGLTAEQVKQLRDADFTFREKRLGLKEQLDGLRLQMDKAFSDDVVDNTAVLALAQKISDVRGKLFVQNIESRLALGKILNADQIKKLKLYGMHQRRGRPGPWKEQMAGRHWIERSGDARP